MFGYHTVFSDPERGAVFELIEERSQVQHRDESVAKLGRLCSSIDSRSMSFIGLLLVLRTT
jgi:hypothetical protein